MVIDNADDLSIFVPPFKARSPSAAPNVAEQKSESLSQFLPLSSHGSILVTSRSREVSLALTGAEDDIITVEPMNESHASALFRKKLGSGHDEQRVAELLEALDYMPLAISQAAAYIRQRAPRISIAKYLGNFHRGERDRAALLETDLGDPRRDQSASNSIIVTWRMSFEHIREQRPSAARLLSFMSFFDRQGIPEFLLRDRSDEADEIDHEFEDDISTLRSYLLISLNLEGDMFSMHRLVQFSTRRWLETHGEEETWKERYVAKMDDAIPDPSCADVPRSRAWFPHAEIAFSYRPASPEYLSRWTEVLVNASWFAESEGNYSVAEKLLLEALKWRELSPGKEDPTTLDAGNQIGMVFYRQGRYNEAEEINRRVLDIRMKVLGESHPETLVSVHNLALVFLCQGKYETAEKMNRRALEGYAKTFGTDHPNYIACMGNLALVLERLGKYEAAEKLMRQILESYEKAPGIKHPNDLHNMGNLALVLQKQGKYNEAEEINRRALKGYAKALGTEHPHYLMCMSNLANVLRGKGDYEVAEKMNRELLGRMSKVFGPNHPDTLSSVNGIALVLECQGKYDEAEELFREALHGYEKALGTDHPRTLVVMSNLASVLRAQEQYEVSEVIYQTLFQRRMEALGNDHPDTLRTMYHLALLLGCQKKYEAAEEMHRQVIERRKKVRGERHPSTLGSIRELASLLRVQGKHEEADIIDAQLINEAG
jgi:tetratricopeptide (TPR) repeat protein